MTDATGHSFLSYRRSRLGEARLLIEAQHDVGIPTWQDLSDLGEGHTEMQLREVLADPITANALCWLTPDVAESAVITRTELPAIVQRMERKDAFFIVPVAAGGLDYAEVPRVVGSYVGAHDLGQWNVQKAAADPAGADEAATIARRILKHRVQAVTRQLPPAAPLRIVLNTRKKRSCEPGVALQLDWTHRFDGRVARPPDAWHTYLLPALETVARACEENAPGRQLVAEGLCALPAAVALGSAFLATRRVPVAWRQVSPKRAPELWAVSASPEPSGFTAEIRPEQTGADDLALLVSVASNVEPALAASRRHLPPFRGLVIVTKPGAYPHDIATPGEAADVVRVVVEGLRAARHRLQPRGTLHLFLAVPAGLAMMIGQMLNTFGPVQTYEHIGTDAVGSYQLAARLQPSA
jgi:hypothetical protein